MTDKTETVIPFNGGHHPKKPDCFNIEVIKQWGGECYYSECIWHSKDEPICAGNTND